MVGRGRGRGVSSRINTENFSRQNSTQYDRDYNSRDRNYHDRESSNSSTRWLRDPPSSSSASAGMGRGRGRGRGRGGALMDNRPAWMTQQEDKQKGSSFARDRERESNRDGDRRRQSERDHRGNRHTNKSREGVSSSRREVDHRKPYTSSRKKRSIDEITQTTHQTINNNPRTDDFDSMIPIDEKKEEEELQKLIQQTQNENKDNNNEDNDNDFHLLQFLKNDDNSANGEEHHESERERKRRERRKRARNSLQNKNISTNSNAVSSIHTEMPKNDAKELQQELKEKDPVTASGSSTIDSTNNTEKDDAKNGNNDVDDDDDFDMFNDEVVTPPTISPSNAKSITAATNNAIRTDDYDDSEGYYKSTIGEIVSFPNTNTQTQSFKVLGTLGKGVFSSVLKCVSTINEQAIIAIKLIRNNETMAKAAQKELRILRLLQTHKKDDSSHQTNHYIVRLIEIPTLDADSYSQNTSLYPNAITNGPLLEYRNHTAIPFEYLPFNLRQILNRFGSGVGINLQAVRSYARQLLSALRHLSQNHIVHADIKPENILVSADYSMVKLADFGSAFFVSDIDARADNPTPYLVSRFYRPPEVILGLEYNHPSVDLWSVGVTLAELFTGTVLFPGHSNNDMIRLFMECMGTFSQKMIKRHMRSYEDRLQLFPFFERDTFAFHRQSIDKVTKRPVVKIVRVIQSVQGRQLSSVMLKSCGTEERGEVLKFADLLSKCLALDPARRVSVEESRKHSFFVKSPVPEKKKKNDEEKEKEDEIS